MDFNQIFDYDTYANQKVFEALKMAPGIEDPAILKLFNHIIGAHHVWLHRIHTADAQLAIWPELTFEEMDRHLSINQEATDELIKQADFSKEVDYHNSKGKKFRNSVGDILYHIANHSNYHRGQMATKMRAAGLEPVETNYIFYKR